MTRFWEPYQSWGNRLRVTETSCCGKYEWACQGGLFLILRHSVIGGYEEAGRGRYREARALWDELIHEHDQKHHRRAMATLASKKLKRNVA